MTLPFVQAKYFTRGGRDPRRVLAEAHHMAEGFGTVSWLTHPTNDNSPTLVIEGTGRVVQMVRAGDMDHSLHIAVDADTHDAPDFGIYSLDVAELVLAPAGVGQLSNHEAVLPYLVSLEWEGFAKDGPNDKQLAAYLNIARPWLRSTFPNIRGLLGHRDFQDYKACPGGKFPWAEIGGHGLIAAPQEGNVGINTIITKLPYDGGTFTIPAGRVVTGFKLDGPGGAVGTQKVWAARDAASSASYDATMVTDATRGDPFLRGSTGFFAGFYFAASAVTAVPNGPPAPVPAPPDPAVLQAARDAGAVAALDHLAPAVQGLVTAVNEARPRPL